jgi:hypothetical protein
MLQTRLLPIFSGLKGDSAMAFLCRTLGNGQSLKAAEIGVQRGFSDASPTRVWSIIQLTSQVLPQSSENDCSKWGLLEAVFDHMNRMKMGLPFSG